MMDRLRKPRPSTLSKFGDLYHGLKRGKVSQTTRVAIYAVAILILVGLGNLFQDTSFGTPLIVMYGIISVLLRVKSEETFKMVVIILIYVLFLTALKNQLLAENFSQYAFLLLIFGVISAIAEQWRESHKKI